MPFLLVRFGDSTSASSTELSLYHPPTWHHCRADHLPGVPSCRPSVSPGNSSAEKGTESERLHAHFYAFQQPQRTRAVLGIYRSQSWGPHMAFRLLDVRLHLRLPPPVSTAKSLFPRRTDQWIAYGYGVGRPRLDSPCATRDPRRVGTAAGVD